MAVTYGIVAADWQVERDTGAVTYVGDDHGGASPSYATVIQFHRWAQGLADDPYAIPASNDEIDMTELLPSARSTDNIITLINGYFIDDTAAEHLYDGSIIQLAGDEIFDGIVNFGNKGIMPQVAQNGAVLSDDWWNYQYGGTATAGTTSLVLEDTGQAWTIDALIGYWVFNTTDGSRGLITDNTATTITVAALEGGTGNDFANTDAYLVAVGLNEDLASGISHRFMVKVRSDGGDIDHRKLIGTNRGWHRSFGEFPINATSRGNNVFALSDAADINNASTIQAVAAMSTAVPTEGLALIDVNNDATDEEYYVSWTKGSQSINELTERMKWYTYDGNGQTLGGVSGEIFRGVSHSAPWDTEAGGITIATNDQLAWGTLLDVTGHVGTFTVGEVVVDDTATPTWAARVIAFHDAADLLLIDVEYGTPTTTDAIEGVSSGATDASITVSDAAQSASSGGLAIALAVDDDGATGNLYFQVIKGLAPADNTRMYHDTDLADYVILSAAATERAIATPFFGVTTGSAIIGAYGVGVAYADLTNADLLTALDGNTYQPPNNVTNTVAGVIHDEDYIIVGPWDGSSVDVNGDPALDKDQLSLSGSLTTNNITSVVVAEAIPADTPNSGYIRLVDDNGYDRRLHYSAWATSTFTIDTTDGQEDFGTVNATSGNDVYITYLDELASGATVTAGSFVTGVQYKILTTGTTDFTLIGAADSSPGTVFTATGAGTGTGTAAIYVTSESYTGVYSSTRNLVVIVRDGGGAAKLSTPIKQFISSWSFSGSNASISVIRTTDL